MPAVSCPPFLPLYTAGACQNRHAHKSGFYDGQVFEPRGWRGESRQEEEGQSICFDGARIQQCLCPSSLCQKGACVFVYACWCLIEFKAFCDLPHISHIVVSMYWYYCIQHSKFFTWTKQCKARNGCEHWWALVRPYTHTHTHTYACTRMSYTWVQLYIHVSISEQVVLLQYIYSMYIHLRSCCSLNPVYAS
jgi:hypothetical protein